MTDIEQQLTSIEEQLKKLAEELGELNLTNNRVTFVIDSIRKVMKNCPQISSPSPLKSIKK